MLKKLYFLDLYTRFGVKTTENFSTIRIRGSVWLSGSCKSILVFLRGYLRLFIILAVTTYIFCF